MAKRKDKEEFARTIDELPQEPPKTAVEFAVRKMKQENCMIFRCGTAITNGTKRQADKVIGRCTACGIETVFERAADCEKGCYRRASLVGYIDPLLGTPVYTRDAVQCPSCGKPVTALHCSEISSEGAGIDSCNYVTFHNVRSHLAILTWDTQKIVNKEGEIAYRTTRGLGAIYIDGVRKFVGGWSNCYYHKSFFNQWKEVKRFYGYGRWKREHILCQGKEWNILEETGTGHSALDVFVDNAGTPVDIFSYMDAWCKYPNIENLVRNGFSVYIKDAIEASVHTSGSYYFSYSKFYISNFKEYFNPKKAKPHEMLSVEKCDLALIRALPLKKVSLYRYIYSTRKVKLTRELLKRSYSGVLDLFKWADGEGISLPAVRTINYLLRQEKRNRNISYLTFRDYLNMAKEIHGDALPSDVVYPNDLTVAHDRAVKIYKAKESEEKAKKILANAEKNEYLTYEDAELGLCIRPCTSQEELTKEGATLHHCVASYGDDCARGNTCILFIRKISARDTPYFTLEYKNGCVVQNRGLRNCARSDDVIQFEEKWLAYIQAKKGKENGKQSTGNEIGRAGA